MKATSKIFLSLALFLGLTGLVRGQYVYNLPQVADGSGIRTTFLFFNNSTAGATMTLSLFDDAGAPMAVSLPGLGSSGVYTLTLQAGQTRFYQSSASGNLVVGSGRVVSSGPIGVSAIFTLYSGQTILTETGIGGSEAVSRFAIAVDTKENRNTGLAIQNLSPVASTETTVTFTLFDADGKNIGTTTRKLAKFGHLALFVGGEDGLFPTAMNIRGQLQVSSTSQVSAQTLLQHVSGAPLTSLPVVPQSSSQTVFNLPQVANGFQTGSDIGVKTTFVMFNPGTEPARVSLDLTDAVGNAFPVTLDDGQTGSQFSFSLGARATRFVSTSGSGPVTAGAARVKSSVPIGVSAVFRLVDGQGRIVTETGVGDSPMYTSLTLPVDLTSGFDTGVALFNQNGSAASVRFQLIDRNGTVIGTPSDQQFAVLDQEAKYVSQIFPGVTNVQGQLAITSNLPLAAVSLRQGAGGSPLTTMPVSRGVTIPQNPIGAKAVQKRLNGIDIDRERQLDVRLEAGHELTGTINLPIGSTFTPSLARLIGSSGEVFPGYLHAPGIGRLRWEYASSLPNGTYTLQLLLATTEENQAGTGLPTVSFQMHSQPGIVISGTTSRDVSVTGGPTYSVTGTLRELLRLPPSVLSAHTVAVLFSSSETGAAALASVNSTGQYSARLPNGQYRADLAVLLAVGGTQVSNAAVLASIGQLTVNGHAVSAPDMSVPLLTRIDGQLITPALPAVPQVSFVLGVDADAPPSSFLKIPLITVPAGTSYAAAGGGPYSIYVKRDQPYDLVATVALPSTNQAEVRFWSTPLPGSSTASFTTEAASRDFTFNPPINPHRVTGTVTSAQGSVLKNVLVTAVCESLDGAVNTSFHASTLTGDDGKFELNLVPGTNYTLFFSPYTSTGEGS